MPYVVFVTAHDEYALRAFDMHALAYLLKPFDDVRFDQTMRHVRRIVSDREAGARLDLSTLVADLRGVIAAGRHAPEAAGAHPSPPPDSSRQQPLERFVVKSGLRSRIVAAGDVDWIEADGNYARLHCGTESHLVSRSMRELADSLDPRRFVRIHRSAIVNVDRIRELRTDDYRDYTVILRDGRLLRLSRSHRQALEEALGGRI